MRIFGPGAIFHHVGGGGFVPTPPPAATMFNGIAGSGGSDMDTFWSFPTHARIDYFAAKGFTCMRIPFRWERMQPTIGGALDTTHKNLLDDRVRYAVSKGLKVMVVPHNFGGRSTTSDPNGTQFKIGTTTLTRAHYADFWGKLAAVWADLPNDVIFDLMNEPESMPASTFTDGTYALAAAYNDAIVAIRAAGATNLVALEGNGFNNAKSFNTGAWYGTANGTVFASTIVDSGNNWCVSVHNYPDVGHGDEGDAINATILRTQMANVIAWCAANNIKCICGEFSATVSDPNGEAVVEDFISYLTTNIDHVIGWSWWEGRSSADTTSLYNIADDAGTDDVRLAWLGL